MPGLSYLHQDAETGLYDTAGSGYKFGFNTQEIETELGEGVTSARFWTYDGKLGRRWNPDPKHVIGLSAYAVLGNNPLASVDVHGDTTFVYNMKAELICTINDHLKNEIVFYSNSVAQDIKEKLSLEVYDSEDEQTAYLNEVAYFLRDPSCHSIGMDYSTALPYIWGFNGRIDNKTIDGMKEIARNSEIEGREHALTLNEQGICGLLRDCNDVNSGSLVVEDLGSGDASEVDIMGKLGPGWGCTQTVLGHTHPTTSEQAKATIILKNGYSWSNGKMFSEFVAPSYERSRGANDYQPQAYYWNGNTAVDIQTMMMIVTKYGFSIYRSDESRGNESIGRKIPDPKKDYYMFNRF